MERSVLVAVDNTPYSTKVLHYLCSLFAGQPELTLHLLTVVACSSSAAGHDWLDQQELQSTIHRPTQERLQASKRHLEAAREKLVSGGINAEQVTIDVRLSGAGIAAEILSEAHRGMYDALVTGKKDLGLVEKMVIGSISGSILRKNRIIPIWLVSGDVASCRFLVPVDCSPHTLDAVDHLAFMLRDNPRAEITLFHSASLLAAEEIAPREFFLEKWGEEWCDRHLQGDATGHFHFLATEQILREAGFPMERVHRLDTSRGIEPAQQIVQLVRREDYGTIVMGRRGQEVDKGIFQGVSDRVLANVKDKAIWIVG